MAGEVESVECSEEIQVMTSLASYLSSNATTDSSAMATVTTTSKLMKINVEDLTEDNFVKGVYIVSSSASLSLSFLHSGNCLHTNSESISAQYIEFVTFSFSVQ